MASAYSTSKFAVRGLTQSVGENLFVHRDAVVRRLIRNMFFVIAAELGPHGITVNAYAP